MTDRPTASTITDAQLDQLYAENGRLAFVINENTRRHKGTIARVDELLATLDQVRALRKTWIAAGPPPLGTSVSRWWDARLIELHDAILGQPKEQP